MSGWVDPRPNDISTEGLRARFKSLQDFLRNPTFEQGVNLGSGGSPVYDSATGTVTPPPTEPTTANSILQGSVRQVDKLPALPDSSVPMVVFLTTDSKLYRQRGGAWTAELQAADMVGEIAPTQIPANAITANHIADFAVTAKKFNTTTHVIY